MCVPHSVSILGSSSFDMVCKIISPELGRMEEEEDEEFCLRERRRERDACKGVWLVSR